jgi:hypothetical protein
MLQPGSAFDRDAMVAHYIGKAATWCIPDDIVIAAKLPHTAPGKLFKSRVRELLRWARRRAVLTPSVDWLCPVATPRPSVRAWRPLGSPDQHREGHLVSIERLRLQFARGDATDRRSRLREGWVSVAGR